MKKDKNVVRVYNEVRHRQKLDVELFKYEIKGKFLHIPLDSDAIVDNSEWHIRKFKNDFFGIGK